MKFYQNKNSGEIIATTMMVELLSPPSDHSKRLGFEGYSRQTAYKAIMPNFMLGSGIGSFVITNSLLNSSYKRINKKIALEKYPNFKQYVFADLEKEHKKTGVSKFDILNKQKI